VKTTSLSRPCPTGSLIFSDNLSNKAPVNWRSLERLRGRGFSSEHVWVSLAPVVAGLLLMLTGYTFFDPLIAGGVAVWFIASTGREIFQSHEELIWPEKIVCGHADHDDAAVTAS
jgi:divalent metal cation (Fe/Co/Zn/Cd) transporter